MENLGLGEKFWEKFWEKKRQASKLAVTASLCYSPPATSLPKFPLQLFPYVAKLLHELVCGLLLWVTFAFLVAGPTGAPVHPGNAVHRAQDFPQFYALGRLVVEHRSAELQNGEALARVVRTAVSPDIQWTLLPVYGPQVALAMAPFASLPYRAAEIAWLAVSFLLYGLAVYWALQLTPGLQRHRVTTWLLALASPGLFQLTWYGQLSMVALAFMGAADMINVVIRMTLIQLETPDDMRGRVSAVNSLFVIASKSMGTRNFTIIRKHILPNVAPALLAIAFLAIGSVIIVEGSLSILGIGVPGGAAGSSASTSSCSGMSTSPRPGSMACTNRCAASTRICTAHSRPSSDAPACTMTGRPCGARGMLSGPRTLKCSPL